jgi:hypothetical protein
MRSAASLEDTGTFARSLGLKRGVTGYMYHTVPVVLHAWLRHLPQATVVIDRLDDAHCRVADQVTAPPKEVVTPTLLNEKRAIRWSA